MSLNPDDSRRRGRSRSPGGRDERDASRNRGVERSRSRVMYEHEPSQPDMRYDGRKTKDSKSYEYEEETITRSSRTARAEPHNAENSYAMPGGFEGAAEASKRAYDDVRAQTSYEEKKTRVRGYSSDESSPDRRPQYIKRESQPSYTRKESYTSYQEVNGREETRTKERERQLDREIERERERRRDMEQERQRDEERERQRDDERERQRYEDKERDRLRDRQRYDDSRTEHDTPSSPYLPSAMKKHYADPQKWEYDRTREGEEASYQQTPTGPKHGSYDRPPLPSPRASQIKTTSTTTIYDTSPHSSQTQMPLSGPGRTSREQVITVEPGQRRPSNAGSLAPRMSSLTISSSHAPATSLALAPGSPLLESYHGTYQSISPMPSPLMIAASASSSIPSLDAVDLTALSSGRRKHARFHDPVNDATALAQALKGSRRPDTGPLIEILPALTHEQIMDLRIEYKKIVKTGAEKKGVNIAKHIKLRLKEEDSSLMKACYAVALGKWESEAYWANFWYQGEKSRRELLIESLMGRTNSEIRAIKDGFSDKKYSDSLTKCMKMELREDKFKKAILLALEEKRMDDWPGVQVDRVLLEEDVRALHKAVRAEKGGESAMINIIVVRSDNHLREVLQVYEATYRSNFAREMLKKSGNLVGELLAHILNGVINKPVRDALLLNHALSLTKSDNLRTELLVSRLVRYHWDSAHMEAVKREYRSRYNKDLQQAVADGTKGSVGELLEKLCIRRMPDDVRRVERVEMSTYSRAL